MKTGVVPLAGNDYFSQSETKTKHRQKQTKTNKDNQTKTETSTFRIFYCSCIGWTNFLPLPNVLLLGWKSGKMVCDFFRILEMSKTWFNRSKRKYEILRYLSLNAKSIHFQIPASGTTLLFIRRVAVQPLHRSSNNDQLLWFVIFITPLDFLKTCFTNLIFLIFFEKFQVAID